MATKTCPYCGGRGSNDRTEIELECAYIPLFGFPLPRTVTKTETCVYCNGTGQIEEE